MAKKKTNCLITNTFFMDWTCEEFRAELDTLNPSVRKKAIEIAKELIEKEGFSREKAIKKAVVMAEEWFYDLEG